MGSDYGHDDDSPLDNHPIFRRSAVEEYLSRKKWDERRVVAEVDDIVIYRSVDTFPSLGFYNEAELKKVRFQSKLVEQTTVQLRGECRDLGLKVSGNKDELIKRILAKKPGINGVIYVDKRNRVKQSRWRPSRRILLLHDDTEEVDQPGGGRLHYGSADVAYIRDTAEASKKGDGFLGREFIEPDIISDIRQLPALLKQHRYDLVLVSTHGSELGLSGKGRSLEKEELINALKESNGVGYLVISACNQAGDWLREDDDDDDDGAWEADFATSIIGECPVRCVSMSGEKVAAGPESSLFLVELMISVMRGLSFSKSLSETMKKHPKRGYQDIPMFYTHAGDPTFQLVKE